MNIDIEKLEQLPTRMSRKEYLTDKYQNMWNLDKFDHPWIRSESTDYYWNKLEYILKSHIGKNVDEAYSKYCKIVEPHEKSYFFKEFNDFYNLYKSKYTLDANRCIQLNTNYSTSEKKRYIFRSFDFEYGYYDTLLKEYVKDPKRFWEYGNNSRYIYCVINGYEKVFESKNDPEYKRLKAEKIKAQRLNRRLYKKALKEKQYTFKHKIENLYEN